MTQLVGEEDQEQRDGVGEARQDELRRDSEGPGARIDDGEARVVPGGELNADE